MSKENLVEVVETIDLRLTSNNGTPVSRARITPEEWETLRENLMPMLDSHKSGKPIVAIDFDGVIHSYPNGWQGADVIDGELMPGTVPFLMALIANGYQIAIYSSRSHMLEGWMAMQSWLLDELHSYHHRENEGEWNDYDMWQMAVKIFNEIDWPVTKPPAYITIDDRCWKFEGRWPTLEELKNFRATYRKIGESSE